MRSSYMAIWHWTLIPHIKASVGYYMATYLGIQGKGLLEFLLDNGTGEFFNQEIFR